MILKKNYWRDKTLDNFSQNEWERLCDGCGRCCLQKLEDEDTGETFFTRIACKLLDLETCRCSDYDNRFDHVPDCSKVYPLSEEKYAWLPKSCAYLRVEARKDLPEWHYLKCGNTNQVHEEGMSVKGWAVSEVYVDPSMYEELIIEFNEENQMVQVVGTNDDY